jgi:hypothetical protein
MMIDTKQKFQMIKAVTRLFGSSRYDGCYSSRICAQMREEHSRAMSGRGNPRFGKPGTMLGKTHTKETKAQMKIDRVGSGNSFFGKTHSQSTKDLVGLKNSKPVLCTTNQITYQSQMEAARMLGLRQSDIANCLSGLQKTTKGYRFSYTT